VRVKFRARDTSGATVSTTQRSRFFSKSEATERAEGGAVAPVVLVDLDDGDCAEELSPQSTVVAPETPEQSHQDPASEPESQTQVEHTQPLAAAGHNAVEEPITADASDTQDAGATQACEPPADDVQPGAGCASALFAKFAFKGAGLFADTRLPGRGSPGKALTLSQMSRRISGGIALAQGADDIADDPLPKRKGERFLDSASKLRCIKHAGSWAGPQPDTSLADEIVDCSDSDKENAIFV
ncbi:hypothetical protein H4R19_003573, partial [Coemansia spiralis]